MYDLLVVNVGRSGRTLMYIATFYIIFPEGETGKDETERISDM